MRDADEVRAESIGDEVISRLNTDPTNRYDLLRVYMRELGTYPLLKEDAFNELHRRWMEREDRAAFDLMVYSNAKLVLSIGLRNAWRGLGLLDTMQEGFFGLMTGINKFDPDRGFKFSTYATQWIRQAIMRAAIDHNELRPYRIPVHFYDKMMTVKAAMDRFYMKHGWWPNLQEAYDEVHVFDGTDRGTKGAAEIELKDVLQCRRYLVEFYQSIDYRPEDPSTGSRMDSAKNVVGDQSKDIASVVDAKRLLGEYRAALSRIETAMETALNPREAAIVRLRLGIGEFESMTLEEIGERYELTRERIRQIEAKGLEKLEAALGVKAEDLEKIAAAIDELSKLACAEDIDPPGEHAGPTAKPREFDADATKFYFNLLCEHIILTPSGVRVVKAPLQVLKLRVKLSGEESENVLRQMRGQDLILGSPPWMAIQVVPEVELPAFNMPSERATVDLEDDDEFASAAGSPDMTPETTSTPTGLDRPVAEIGLAKQAAFLGERGIKTIRHLTEHTKDQLVIKGVVRRRLGFVRECLAAHGYALKGESPAQPKPESDASASPPIVRTAEPVVAIVKPVVIPTTDGDSLVLHGKLTRGQVYQALAEHVNSVSGEPIVRGPVLILGTKFRTIWPPKAIEMLEQLARFGDIRQRDGWRSVELTRQTGDKPVARPETVIAKAIPIPPLQIVRPHSGQSDDEKPATVKHAVLNTAIAWIERQLPPLRELLGVAHERLGKLEATLTTLKEARDGHQQTATAVDRALGEAEAATVELFALLRQSGST